MTDPFAKCLLCPLLSVGLYHNSRKVKLWDDVISGIKNELSMWKGRLLFLRGRVCLIKSLLFAKPLFYFLCSRYLSPFVEKLSIYKGSSYGEGT